MSSRRENRGTVKRVVLLSRGLDTSVMLKWIADTYKAEVIALTLDLGQQGDDLDAIKKKALKLGPPRHTSSTPKMNLSMTTSRPSSKQNGSYQGIIIYRPSAGTLWPSGAS